MDKVRSKRRIAARPGVLCGLFLLLGLLLAAGTDPATAQGKAAPQSVPVAPAAPATPAPLTPPVADGTPAAPGQAPAAGAAAPAVAPPPDPGALIDFLRDDARREALIVELEKLRAATDAQAAIPAAPDEAAAPNVPLPVSLVREVAEITQAASERAIGNAKLTWLRLQRVPNLFDGLSGQELPVLLAALRVLFVSIATTVAVYAALRWLAARIVRRIGARADGDTAGRSVTLFLASAVLSVAAVGLAWAAGYALALLALGNFGQIGIRQALYLNAFLIVELARVVVRVILQPFTGGLRLIPMDDRAARAVTRWLSFLIALIGYGNLLVVPIINDDVSIIAGRAVATLIALVALLLAVWLVLANRSGVARWILGEDQTGTRKTGIFATIARRWHWFALVYLVVMFVIVLTRPAPVIFAAFASSGRVALVLLAGVVASRWLTKLMARGVVLPERLREPLPLLESRLNRFVPRALFVVRTLILLAVAAFVLDSLGLFDTRTFLASKFGLSVTGKLISVGTMLVGAFLAWLALNSWVDYRLSPVSGRLASARETTLLALLRNAATIAIAVVTLMFVLSEIGLDIAPLLASAGVLGLAIGFGSQKLVQDIITGIFIQFENAMNVGDVVTVAATTGTVERLTIRSVSLRDVQGTFHIVPFSSVDMVSNFTRGFSYHVADMGVAYSADLNAARQAMVDACDRLRADPKYRRDVTGDLEWFGVNAFLDNAVVLRARIRCAPGKQWAVGRAYNELVKQIFDERGIEIPSQHKTLVWTDPKAAAAPPPPPAPGTGEQGLAPGQS